ncbi:MAG TPA: LytR C-terminal domain-containing protein [Solirubrobacterales bacterium]|nr:LytR C-terminal domain-containing protein [Solirubrobacterales bacterium]
MIDLIERIGPILGIVTFLGFAVLAFLIFQQAREVRRLREWAGRAPERAEEAAAAAAAAAEARGEEASESQPTPEREGRLRELWRRLNQTSPLDPRYVVVLLAAALIAAAALTGAFGLLGGDDGPGDRERRGGGGQESRQQGDRPEKVAVLNATQVIGADGVVIQGVPGLADQVAEDVIRPADGFRPGNRDNATSGFDQTTIMFEPGARQAATSLAAEVAASLGEAPVEPMIEEVRDLAGGARLALVVGSDDAEF